MRKTNLAFCFILAISALFCGMDAAAQQPQRFTKADTLRGLLTPLRSCYDINYYHLDIKINIEEQSIAGSNEFTFTATQDFDRLQFDLFENLEISKVVYRGAELHFTREFNAVFLTFPKQIKKGEKQSFKVFYAGKPVIAKRPPWDGGFIFSKDNSGNPWVSVACQGLGASSWWPNKDHQSDEVDSMLISISVPGQLREVSNGRLRSVIPADEGYNQYNWFVASPINNYNISLYIGKYAHWSDQYNGEKGKLSLDFWSLESDSAQARPHWEADVKRMLRSFEYWFGPYPFYKDGYKLVQAPHLGMEHQSAVAYGNLFRQGYLGKDLSGSGWGLKFDFITIHESGHEWFGNNITSKDIADMWIHEAFTCYSETLFTESEYGKDAGTAYVSGIRQNIMNDMPIIGPYHVNTEGSGDMYYKGANMIHNIRQLIHNDEKFRAILRGLNQTFHHQTVTTHQIENYIAVQSGLNLNKVFDQYLRHKDLPVLEYDISKGRLSYRWRADVRNFDMPVKVSLKPGRYDWIYPSSTWKAVPLASGISKNNFKADPNFYIGLEEKAR
ncbi:M1 family metallopeptidase [Pedobacter sp. JY14-1]|uniref:M1 family metallopeptidase n=1 Tax=Pedobacter sp. JY14-1 TaxID=3034151 RepID=UPI0023E33545|nr:M1 family metallopeptidase [Pedobacter sp. JY14-1]